MTITAAQAQANAAAYVAPTAAEILQIRKDRAYKAIIEASQRGLDNTTHIICGLSDLESVAFVGELNAQGYVTTATTPDAGDSTLRRVFSVDWS